LNVFETAERNLIEFHRMAGATIGESPAVRDADLRARLILEEALETVVALKMAEAMDGAPDIVSRAAISVDVLNRVWDMLDSMFQKLQRDGKFAVPADKTEALVNVIDGCQDTLYVTFGTGVSCGTPFELFWREVHRANMQKLGGELVDGKLTKPRNFRPPQIRAILERERPNLSNVMRERIAAYGGPR
jgi:predicted HAD superfamily Cof-like phosphohydrolase